MIIREICGTRRFVSQRQPSVLVTRDGSDTYFLKLSSRGRAGKISRKASRPPTWERFQEKPVIGVTLSPGSKSLRHPKQVTYGSEVSHLGFACGEVNHPSGLIFRNKTWKSVRNREKPWMADSECRIFALWFRKNHGQCAAPINFNNLTI